MESGRKARIIIAGVAGAAGLGFASGEAMAWDDGRPMQEAQDEVAEADALAGAVEDHVPPVGEVDENGRAVRRPIGEEGVVAVEGLTEALGTGLDEGFVGRIDEDKATIGIFIETDGVPIEEYVQANLDKTQQVVDGIEGDVDSARARGQFIGAFAGLVLGAGAGTFATRNRGDHSARALAPGMEGRGVVDVTEVGVGDKPVPRGKGPMRQVYEPEADGHDVSEESPRPQRRSVQVVDAEEATPGAPRTPKLRLKDLLEDL